MNRKATIAALLTAGLLVTAGCTTPPPSPGSSVKPPQGVGKQVKETRALNSIAQKFLPPGAKLLKPLNPKGAEAVQKADLDGDGRDEVLAVFTGGEKGTGTGILVLQEQKGKWEKIMEKTGSGSNLDWAGFADLSGDDRPELLIGWEGGPSVGNGLEIFSRQVQTWHKMADIKYHKLEVADIKGKYGTDGKAELAVWQKDTGEVIKELKPRKRVCRKRCWWTFIGTPPAGEDFWTVMQFTGGSRKN